MTIRISRRRFAACLAAAAPLATLSRAAWAADEPFPSKPLRLVVPFPPGGSNDPIARLVAQHLSSTFGQPVVVENKAGAGTMLAAEFVARSAPDGYTILLGSGSVFINPSLFRKNTYDPMKDFAGISLATSFPLILHVHPSVPARNVGELLALARVNPGKLAFGSGGVGAANHLAGEMFKSMAGVDILHVPYKGGAPALVDAIGGQFQVMFGGFEQSLPHVRAGRLRALAVTGARRSPLLPEVPTVAESGVPGYDVTSWNGFMVPSRTPPAVIARLNSEIVKALSLPATREKLAADGLTALPTSPEETQAFIVNETTRWKKLIEANNIKAES